MSGTTTIDLVDDQDAVLDAHGPAHVDPVTRLLAGAFRRTPMAMMVLSAEGVVEYVNDATCRIFGVHESALVGRTADSVMHPDDVEMLARYAHFDAEREPVAFDHRIIRSDGEVRWLQSTVVALDSDGTQSFFVQSVDHTATRRHEIELRAIDTVTGLLSRDGLMAKFDDLRVARDGPDTGPYTLFAVDIDDFRGVNDRLGTVAADRALYLVGACIRGALPVGVHVARLRADVFVALVGGMDAREANLAVERLLGGLEASSIGLGLPALGYKLGAVVVRSGAVDPAEAVRVVEQRAQDPATTAHGVVVVELAPAPVAAADPAESLESSEWASMIDAAIVASNYIAVGEPLLAMHEGLAPLQRFELFVRLVLPDHKWVALPKFEPYAQRLGRSADVDRWMVAFAVDLLGTNPALELEVNISTATMRDPAFLVHLADVVRAAPGVDPAHLLLAVTERDVADDVRQALMFSEGVRATGVGICLDDHGSVADGVRYLSLIGAKRVKLTSQYVRGAKQSSSDRAMVGVLAGAAQMMGIEVAAPFVTDDATGAALRTVGVDLAQGRLVGHATRLTLPS